MEEEAISTKKCFITSFRLCKKENKTKNKIYHYRHLHHPKTKEKIRVVPITIITK
jgi:hypothetical protein